MEKQRENQIEQDELFRFWFAGLKGIGNREKIQLTKEFPQKKTLYYIEETALKKRLKEKWTEGKAETITQIIQEGKRRWSKEIVAEWQKKGIALVTYEQEKYPDRLRNISSPPYALYVMGKLPEKGRRTAAIVGARNCTYYGETYARKIGKILSEAGISVISGLADVVIIIEARERSGSLITADMALEQGKDVYALPGSVDSQLSRGCNRLIKQGAGIILSPEELLEELNICGNFVKNLTETKIILETEQNIVYSCLDLNPKSIGQILAETKLSIPELMRQLVSLEMNGKIKEISKGYYVRGNW